jgi:endoglucanase
MVKNRKFIFAILLIVALGCVIGLNTNIYAAYNYGEALQKAIYFYECQQSGVLPSWNRVEWRGPSGLKDYVQGGWYDAGDHVKFGLPMSYSAGMLAWAAYEYKSGFETAGQWEALSNNLKFVLDYLVKCHQGSQLVYQIGDGSTDHSWWGPVEVLEEKMTRPYYTTNASCVTGDTAATLAIGSLVFNNSTYLQHAKDLFTIADTTKSDAGYTAANGFYASNSGYWDELIWAAAWLYIATGDNAYLSKAESYVANLKKQGYAADAPIEYKWAQCWDDKHYGALLLLARITGKQLYIDAIERHLDWWTVGYNGERITYTPGGLAWLDTWGSLRYAANTAFIAAVYGDWVQDATKKQRYQDFTKSQINYILGNNPRSGSYVVGFGSKSPQHPHHRTAHGSWCGMQNTPANHRHIIYGALVGGPNASDSYNDAISDYTCNEVATDYNAAFTGCLAKMVQWYGGTSLANFPVPETREPEMFAQAIYNNYGGTYTEVRLQMNNRSGWPARVTDKLSCRFYVDLTEAFDNGLTLSDVYAKTSGTVAKASAFTQYSGNIYYTTIDFTGTKIYPGGMNEYYKEIQFQIGTSRGDASCWSTANDYSFQGLNGTTFTTSTKIPVYDNGILVFGSEPSGTTPGVTPTRTPTPVVTVTPTPVRTATPVVATPTPVRTATPRRTATPQRTATPGVTATPTPVVTVTPTPVITATPAVTATPVVIVTPTPSTSGGAVKVQFYNQNTAATSNQIYLNIKLLNTGSSAVALANVKIRYYYTIDGVKSQNFYCDYSPVGSSNVNGTFVTMATAKTGADTYVEIGFSSGAGSLAAGGNTTIQARVAKSDWTNYTQTNDYSFNSSATTYVDWTKVTGYVSGSLQWGVEP